MKYILFAFALIQFSFGQNNYTIECEGGQIIVSVEEPIQLKGNYNSNLKYNNQNKLISFSNISVEYDYKNSVSKVGGISISYFMDRISSVGGLVLNYDENGNFIDFVGNLDCTALEN